MSTRASPRTALLIFMLLLALAPMVAMTSPAYADAPCQSYSSHYDAGKTPEGFQGHASDGCHTADWTSSIGVGPDSGKVTFRTIGNISPGEPGYTLPGPQGGNYCQYRAAHEANGYFTNWFQVPVGTEVTVSYSCR